MQYQDDRVERVVAVVSLELCSCSRALLGWRGVKLVDGEAPRCLDAKISPRHQSPTTPDSGQLVSGWQRRASWFQQSRQSDISWVSGGLGDLSRRMLLLHSTTSGYFGTRYTWHIHVSWCYLTCTFLLCLPSFEDTSRRIRLEIPSRYINTNPNLQLAHDSDWLA